MKILIDIGHPAHVHYFRNLTKLMVDKGHEILFTCRDKEVTISLLEYYNFNYICLGKPYKSKLGKLVGLFYFTLRIFIISLKYKPDFFLNASIYSAIVSWLKRKPHISLEDTFNMEQVSLYLPFTSVVLTGDYNHILLGKKEIKYNGYQELLYLHPNYFQADKNVKEELGIYGTQKYFIVRFVSWNASHDFGHKGLNENQKHQIIQHLKKYGKVFISSETNLQKDLEQFNFPLAPHKLHDALCFADLYIGEGATMASECAMLGTPAIYLNTLEAGSINDQENKGLLYHFRSFDGVLGKIDEILSDPDFKNETIRKKNTMLTNKIDVTAFLVWFVENYPQSFKIMKENPEYQYNFK